MHHNRNWFTIVFERDDVMSITSATTWNASHACRLQFDKRSEKQQCKAIDTGESRLLHRAPRSSSLDIGKQQQAAAPRNSTNHHQPATCGRFICI